MNTPKTTRVEVVADGTGTYDVKQFLKDFHIPAREFSFTTHFGLPYVRAMDEAREIAKALNVPVGVRETLRKVA